MAKLEYDDEHDLERQLAQRMRDKMHTVDKAIQRADGLMTNGREMVAGVHYQRAIAYSMRLAQESKRSVSDVMKYGSTFLDVDADPEYDDSDPMSYGG